MSKAYLGIDIGTSSVKAILKNENGNFQKAREGYEEISPKGWYDAVIKALSSFDYPENVAIGLSSQVGTYIINEKDVISWNNAIGTAEVEDIQKRYEKGTFVKEISMVHPKIASYPIPRLRHIEKIYGKGAVVCQLKDLIGKMLTGVYRTDKFSWRGLANIENGRYSEYFINEVGSPILPKIGKHTDKLGYVNSEVCSLTGIPENTPVYIGLNDFFASLVGMGIGKVGDMFDITGTSEHLGAITDTLDENTAMVSGPFITDFVHYGVTASSGASLDFAISEFGADNISLNKSLVENSPIFLPYLNGERAPIFDSNAHGTFFGINAECNKTNLAYSILEGVVFSIYHIYENLGSPFASKLTVSGGAANSDVLNYLKAEIFNIPVNILEESDTSALGSLMVAAKECGCSTDFVKVKKTVTPDGKLRELLLKRFQIYKKLYPALKDTFKEFKEM